MEYLSSRQTAEKWGCSLREVQRLLTLGRVPGAKKCGVGWLVPADAKKPADPRKSKNFPPDYLPGIFVTSLYPIPLGGADTVPDTLPSKPLKAQYAAELDYLRGDFEKALDYAEAVPMAAQTFICANATAMSCAISLGDYDRYSATVNRLTEVCARYDGTTAALLAEASLATAQVSMFAPENVPEWLKSGDFSAFPEESKPWLCYLYVKLLQNEREYAAMLSAARVGLSFITRPGIFTISEIYLRLMCAAACAALDDHRGTAEHLDAALSAALTDGLIMPFAETVTAYSGQLEKCLQKSWPEYYAPIVDGAETAWKRWIGFHNQFARDNVTLVLTLKEYHLALLLARGVSYAQAAQRMHMSVGSVNNAASLIYQKLYIHGRRELPAFLL